MKTILLILLLSVSVLGRAEYVTEQLCCLAMATPLSATQEKTQASKTFRTRLLISSLALGVVLYGATNWWEDSSSEFRVRNEGWFEADSPNGGADKLGHGYSAYVSTRLLTQGFQWAGHSQSQAAQLSAITSAGLLFGVEVLDGFTERYGFSTVDMVMNLTGVGLGLLLAAQPKWDERFDVRLHYWPSAEARRLNEYDPVADYSGQTYLWITKTSGFASLATHSWLRYLELALGYGTRGYQPTDALNEQPKERNLYVGLSVNLSLLLNDKVFKGQEHYQTTQKVTTELLEYLQLPGTVLLHGQSL